MLKNRLVILVLACVALMATRATAQKPGPWDQRLTQEQALAALKSPDTSLHDKFAACRQLAVVGTKDAVPALAPLLLDEKLSHMARYALEPINDASVDAVFREALPKLKGRMLAGVINSIAKRRDAAAVGALTGLLKDEDLDVAAAASAALGRIGTAEAGKALEAALPAMAQRPALYDGCLIWGETAMAGGNWQGAVESYDRLRAIAGTPRQIKIGAARGAVLARGSGGTMLLIELVNSSDPDLFAVAQRVAIELQGEDVTRALTEQMPSLTPDRQAGLLAALGNRGDSSCVPAILTMARNAPDMGVRIAAMRTLTQLKRNLALPFLVETAVSGDEPIKKAAQASLASFPGTQADAAVTSMLEVPAQRITGIELIARRRLSSATPALLKLATQPDETIRVAALRALADTAGPDQFGALAELVLRSDGATLEAAEGALSAVAIVAPREAAADTLADAAAKAGPAQKRTLMRALRTVGGPKALGTVVAATKDADAASQDAAVRTLSEWTTADAIAPLLDLAKGTANPTFRSLALRGSMRLASDKAMSDTDRLAACKQALPLAGSDNDKKLVLAALALTPSAEALGLVTPLLDAAGVRDEASAAAIAIGEKIVKANPKAVAEAMDKVVNATQNPGLKQKAKGLLERAKSN